MFRTVAVPLCASVSHISQMGARAALDSLPRDHREGECMERKKRKKTTLQGPESSRKQERQRFCLDPGPPTGLLLNSAVCWRSSRWPLSHGGPLGLACETTLAPLASYALSPGGHQYKGREQGSVATPGCWAVPGWCGGAGQPSADATRGWRGGGSGSSHVAPLTHTRAARQHLPLRRLVGCHRAQAWKSGQPRLTPPSLLFPATVPRGTLNPSFLIYKTGTPGQRGLL